MRVTSPVTLLAILLATSTSAFNLFAQIPFNLRPNTASRIDSTTSPSSVASSVASSLASSPASLSDSALPAAFISAAVSNPSALVSITPALSSDNNNQSTAVDLAELSKSAANDYVNGALSSLSSAAGAAVTTKPRGMVGTRAESTGGAVAGQEVQIGAPLAGVAAIIVAVALL